MSPRPPASARLDRGQILTLALALSDREGLDALSLRKIAAELNVTPMALYWHFKDKEALLDALVEHMFTEIDPRLAESGDLRSIVAAVLAVLRAHPSLAGITPVRFMRTDIGLEIGERILGLLRAAGHSGVAAAQFSSIMINAVTSLVLNRPGDVEVHNTAIREKLVAAKRARLKSLPPETFPHLTETADYFLYLPDEDEYYERGLAFVLAFA
ncbi:TetR/AcrR family transcriptional regulator [Catenuloplanes japonicus]|uniref:TetR/AcrR family transcriptional regulator n=1 Tax=Catenuloplanes japonicus TaxID=33876 RepID=UPI00052624BC|nr:TetR family transcriptional regulator [Catenuloplanes japonicus]